MGIPVLILGESGTGKSASMRNFTGEELSLINVDGKPLPFRNSFKKMISTDSAPYIISKMIASQSKIIVIDDAQYIMANEFMRRAKEKGYDKFSDIGQGFFYIIETVKKLNSDVIVYFLSHTEETNTGSVKCKTVGKMLDSAITLEGKFTIVLRTAVKDGHFYFSTQNSGYDTVKSPIGMFDRVDIDNDLKAVDTAIRQYYNMPAITGGN